jgi:hypothetical protein
MAEAEVERGDDGREEETGGGEGGHHQEKDGVGAEAVQVGGDQKQAGEYEGREEGEEAGVPELIRVQTDGGGGAQAEAERGDEADRSEDAEGGKEKMTGVDEVGVHGGSEPRARSDELKPMGHIVSLRMSITVDRHWRKKPYGDT